MIFSVEELLFIIPFYLIGALLGYFAFRHQLHEDKWKMIGNCALTTFIGTFLAFIFATYLVEHNMFSREMCMVLGGLGSFGFPDIVINYWKKFANMVFHMIIHKLGLDKHKEEQNEPRDN